MCKAIVDTMMQAVTVQLRDNQRDDLRHFCAWLYERYSEKAIDIWKKSAMIRMVNNNDSNAVSTEFLRWVYTDDRIDSVLVMRRIKERMLWEGRTE